MKPNYCINEYVESCDSCCYVNYGLDCRNNPVQWAEAEGETTNAEEEHEATNWELAQKHGLGGHALSAIHQRLPEWAFDLEPEKISDLIKAMDASHKSGKSIEAKEIDDFFGFPFWSVDWSEVAIDDLPRLQVGRE